jgi:hypothetical protein
MDGLHSIFPGLVINTSGGFVPHLPIPVKGIPWHERPVDNAMLRDSLKVDASGAMPTCIGTYIEAYVDGYVHSSLILEPTKDILSWMDLPNDNKEHFRTLCPAFLRDQPLKVFFSCSPPDQEDKYTMWLRNSLLAHYPDNMYLVHLMDSIDVSGVFPQSFSDFTDSRLSWIPLQHGGGKGKYSTPTIGIFKYEGDHLDDALHIMHITVGSFVAHLVGKKSAEDFDRFTQAVLDEDMGVPVHVGFIHIPADGETGIHPSNWGSL